MASGMKFFIYGGGRWREVDINDGRVEGWGRARFIYPKRGKVRVAKTGSVLSALRDLAAGRNSAVRDGAHLPYKMCIPSKAIEQKPKINMAIQCIPQVDAGIQTSLPSQTLTFPDSLNKQNSRKKRRRPSTSTEEDEPTKITTVATVHNDSTSKAQTHKRNRSRTISSEEYVHDLPKNRVPSLKLEKADSAKYNLYKRRRSKSSDSVVWVVLPKMKDNINHSSPKRKITEYMKPKSKVSSKRRQERSSLITSEIKSRNKLPSSETQTAIKTRSNYEKHKVERSVSSSDEQDKTLSINNKKSNLQDKKVRQDCKEIIIDESDVDVLRNYLINHESDFDLLKFDQDDEYKKLFFYKINPLVNVERCPKIARMSRSHSQDEISLADFVSQLGLKSITKKLSKPKRYKMRKLPQKRSYLKTDSSDSDTDTENSDQKRNIEKKHKTTFEKSLNYKKNISSLKVVTTDSATENSELFFDNIVKKTNKSDKLLGESNKVRHKDDKSVQSKTYEIRKSIHNKSNYVESANSNVDSSESEYVKTDSSKKESKIFKQRTNNEKLSSKHRKRISDKNNTDFTSSNDSSDVENFQPTKVINTRRQNRSVNLDLTHLSDENSDIQILKSSRNTRNSRQGITKIKRFDDIDLTISDEDVRKSKTKVSKASKQAMGKAHDKMNDNKHNVSKKRDMTSDDDTSDVELPKTTKRSQNITNDKRKNNNSDSKVDIVNTGSKSSKEIIKTKNLSQHNSVIEDSQPKDKQNQKKVNNKMRHQEVSDSNNNISEEELSKSSRQLRRTVSNKVINNHSINEISVEKNKRENKNNNQNNSNGRKTDLSKVSKDNNKNKIINNTKNESLDSSYDTKNRNLKNKLSASKKPDTQDTKSQTKMPQHTISKRPSSSGQREYSNLEDHAIVAWVSVGGRARCVNGNRIWRELQDDFFRIAGQKRSWHSLRNRYLRYILPRLGALAVPQVQAARLRAAAATGEIKSLKISRRNSIFGVPSRGALSRRPPASLSDDEPMPAKRHKHDNIAKVESTSPKRALRSSLAPPLPSRDSPRYSDITRKFTDNHRQNDKSSEDNKKTENTTTKTSTKNLSINKDKTGSQNSTSIEMSSANKSLSTTNASSATKNLSLRRSLRNQDSPAPSSIVRSAEKEKSTRTRKLYNPGSML